jgi:predicted site-specific integrase-resolvase
MMTILWSFLKNPKNILLLILAALVVFGTGVVLFQRVSIANQKTTIETQAKDIEGYERAQEAYRLAMTEYADQVTRWKKLAESQQAIANQTAKEIIKIKYIQSKCVLEGKDAKIVNGIVDYFNSGLRLE